MQMTILEQTQLILSRCLEHTEERFRLRLNDDLVGVLIRCLEDRCNLIEEAQEMGEKAGMTYLMSRIPNLSQSDAKEMLR